MPRPLNSPRRRPGKSLDFEIPVENVLDLRKFAPPAPPPPPERKRVPKLNVAQIASSAQSARRLLNRKPSWKFPQWKLSLPMRRAAVPTNSRVRPAFRAGSAFASAALITLLPIFAIASVRSIVQAKGDVLTSASTALNHLNIAKAHAASFDFSAATREFQQANIAFSQAGSSLDQVNGFLRGVLRIVPGSALASGEHLLTAGKALSEAGTLASELLGPATNGLEVSGTSQRPQLAVQFDLPKLREGMVQVEEKLKEANDALKRVSINRVPESQREQVREAQAQIATVVEQLPEIHRLIDFGVSFLGYGEEKEYLLAFQNNAELRPAGGFLGSLALVAVKDGQLRVVEVPGRGPYELDTPSTTPLIPPGPIQYINGTWKIQDANWWPDFPTSAEKVMWFYEQSRGFPVDGVIALTPNVVQGLLALTGPIDMQESYGVTVTADSFPAQAQREVELEYDKAANRPKQFIADLLPLLLQRTLAMAPDRWSELLATLDHNLSAKHIIIASRDQTSKDTLAALGWSGRIREAPQDYLSIVTANIAGGKTDRVIQNTITNFVDVQADGSMVATVSLTRRHDGIAGEVFTGQRNLSYVQLYAPVGSQLLAVQGFSRIDPSLLRPLDPKAVVDADLQRIEGTATISEATGTRVTTEFGKTVFANWLEVQPGEEKTMTFRYRLPFMWFSGEGTYQLLVQKQPGAVDTPVKVALTPPPGTQLVWSAPPGRQDGESVIFSATLDQDREFSAILKSPK
jgi:hypothetical protein